MIWATITGIVILSSQSKPGFIRLRAGTVREVSGSVWVRNANSQPRKLPIGNKPKIVFVGDEFRVDARSKLSLVYRTGEPRTISPSKNWFRIGLRRTEKERKALAELTGMEDPLNAAIKPAVKARGGDLFVLDGKNSPAQLLTFVIPKKLAAPFKISIVEDKPAGSVSQTLLTLVDSRLTSSDLKRLRDALSRYQSEKGTGPLLLMVEDQFGKRSSAAGLYLMTASEEKNLLRQLGMFVKEKDDVSAIIGTLKIWKEYGLSDRFEREIARFWELVNGNERRS